MPQKFKPISSLSVKNDKEYGLKVTAMSLKNPSSFLNRFSLALSWGDPNKIQFTSSALLMLKDSKEFSLNNPDVHRMFTLLAEYPHTSCHEAISEHPYLPLEIADILLKRDLDKDSVFKTIALKNRYPNVLRLVYNKTDFSEASIGNSYILDSIRGSVLLNLAVNKNTPGDLLVEKIFHSYSETKAKVLSNPNLPVILVKKALESKDHNTHFNASRNTNAPTKIVVDTLNRCLYNCFRDYNFSTPVVDLVMKLLSSKKIKLVRNDEPS
jgi:hypothetical protein